MAFTCKFVMVVAAVFLLGLIEFVSGNAALIDHVCGRTASPEACHSCFKLYNRSSNEDLKALGRTSIDCASSQSLNLIGMVGDKVANTTNNEKNAYVYCAMKLYSGDQEIVNAFLNWQNSLYNDAGQTMLYALQDVRDCGNGLQTFHPPPSIRDGLHTLEGFCDASNGVLNQIHFL